MIRDVSRVESDRVTWLIGNPLVESCPVVLTCSQMLSGLVMHNIHINRILIDNIATKTADKYLGCLLSEVMVIILYAGEPNAKSEVFHCRSSGSSERQGNRTTMLDRYWVRHNGTESRNRWNRVAEYQG